MKSTLTTFILYLILSFGSHLSAQTISVDFAKKIAQNHLVSVGGNSLKSAGPNQAKLQFTSYSITSTRRDTLYYVLNDTINRTFVIVAADRRSTPIIGYSLDGNYSEMNQPPAFIEWMENRKQEIAYIKQNNLLADSKISQQWERLTSSNIDNTEAAKSVEPLLKTKWGQGTFYNSKCPGHVPTGCVATSMAQIMKYWNYPTKGTGSHSYLSAAYGILSADFGSTTYQWSEMPNEVVSQNDAVATLMYHCGVALNMRYSPLGSGSYDPRDELVKYFNYSSMAEYVDKRSFLPGDWVNLLKSELDFGRPIWYNGAAVSHGGGHAFVCDGYQNSDYFHFNWGWEGSFDGYFYLESLNPGWLSFSVFQAAIIKIFPSSLPDEYHGFLLSTKTVGIGINGGTIKLDVYSSTDLTASSNQTWLTINPVAGTTSNKAITFNVTANPSKNIRKATVTISASGFASQSISVTQYGQVEVISGSLKTVLGDQLSTTTSLKLNGTIDARDFKTMRDEMPALTEIDLSGVKITSYTGTEGTIGDENFIYQANAIPSFTFLFPKSVRSKSRLQSIVLPLSITSINDYAFQGCKNLTIENIPSSLTSIGDGAFLECNCLQPLIISSSVKNIGVGAFSGFKGTLIVDVNNPNYSSIDGVLFNKSKTILIQCPISKTDNYTIPSSVTSINNGAFYGCNGLTSVSIPSSVTVIEDFAFSCCTGLTSIMIPQTVTSIGQRALWGINGLISVDINNANYSSIDGILFNKNQTEIIQCPVLKAGSYTIPSTVTSVREEAFHSCINITSIIIPSSVKKIGSFSFNCVGLSTIYSYSVTPSNLSDSKVFSDVDTLACILNVPFGTKAHYAAANQWKSFKNIVEMPGLFLSDKTIGIEEKGGNVLLNVSSSVKWIATSDQSWLTLNHQSGNEGFNEIILNAAANPTTTSRNAKITISATGLVSQTIEVTQYSIVESTAGNLKTILSDKLASITSLTLIGAIDARDFKTMRDEMPVLTSINLKDATIAEYKGSEGTSDISPWNYPANTIPDCAFYNYKSPYIKDIVSSIILPSSVTSIGRYAFNNCTGLTTISLPPLLTTIGESAFSRCNGLTTINIPSAVTSIQDNAFGDLNASIVVDANNHNYSSIEGVLYNKDQTRIIQCPSSKTDNFIIPTSATSIGNYAFTNCTYLKSITIPSTVATIGEGAFSYCSGLKSVNIPSGVTSIRRNLFAYCRELTTITIPASVASIGSWAFIGCSGLSSIYNYAKSLIDINYSSDVFSGVNRKSCTLNVPYGTKKLYSSANQWQDFTNIVEMPGIFLSDKTVIEGMNGGTTIINLSSSTNWTASSDQTWLTINPQTGITGFNDITLFATANPTALIRKATVTISAEGLASQTIEITQYGIVEATAGNLKSILGVALSTINSLVLTGFIDARDFKIMRDEMPELADLDLSNVTIVEYTGKEGTADTSRVYYPANCIPSGAFHKSRDGKGNSLLKSVIIPSSVNMIGNYAFNYCFGLTNFNIPSQVSSIGVKAFNRCKGINEIYIPASVSSIGVSAFGEFSGSITVDTNNLYYSAIDGVLFNKAQTELVQCPVSKAGSFTIPASVTTIHDQAFSWCEKLSEITISPKVTSIGEGAFSYCHGLESINIPWSVVSIGRSAFIYCGQLRTIEIPRSINFIGSWAFSGCSSLKTIYAYPKDPINLANSTDVFSGMNNSICILYVPYGSKVRYKSAPQWKDFPNIIENKLPIAKAGTDQAIYEKNLVTLNGTTSFDPENKQLTYLWTAPADISLSSTTSEKPTFTAPEVKDDTEYLFSLIVNDGWDNSITDNVIVTIKNLDQAPYLKNPVSNISVDKRAPDQIIDLKSVFMDDDASDILTYKIASNSNSAIVYPQITGTNLILSFSPEHTGSTTIEIAAESNGKMVSTKFTVEVKIPTGLKTIPGKQQITIWPNPTNGMINVVLDQNNESDTELIIMDSTGKVVLRQNIRKEENQIDLLGLPRGQYLVKTNKKGTNTQKIILE